MMLETKILHHLSATPLFAIISLTVAMTDVITFSIDLLNNRIVKFFALASSTCHSTHLCVCALVCLIWCRTRRGIRRFLGVIARAAERMVCFCSPFILGLLAHSAFATALAADVNSRRGATSRFSRVRGRKNPEHRLFEGAFRLRKIKGQMGSKKFDARRT